VRTWKTLGMSLVAATVLGVSLLAAGSSSAGATTAHPATTATATTPAISAPALPASSYRAEHVCSTPKPGARMCFALKLVPKAGITPKVTPNATPSGFGPSDLRSAYSLPTTGGSGVTVAIVDAYNDPTAEADLAAYRTQYGLPACTTANGCFKKVSQSGSTTALPATNTGWSGEIALDIEMVSAACPSCHILLVEATSATDANLDTAVDYAAAHAQVVSNSYGGSETSSDPTNSHYTHAGVSVLASSGDEGYVVEFPAASPSVIAVGGTKLTRTTANSRGWTEAAWNTSNSEGAGSGCSKYETKPSWQTDTGCTKRTVADVSAVADPATGVAVYDTTGGTGWTVYGGTSVASPLVAGILSVTGHAGISASYLYAHPSFLYDVTAGQTASTCTSYLCRSGTGYDGPTGLGTPNGALLAGGTTAVNDFSIAAAPVSVVAGASGTSAITTATTSGSAQTIALTATGAPTGVGVSFNPASVTSGAGSTATVTVAAGVAPGTYPITVTGTAPSGTHAMTLSLTVSSASSGCSRQLLVNPGFESGATGWTGTSGVINTDGKYPRTGVGYAWLDGYGSAHTDTLTQTVSVPTGCTSLVLSFWVKITTNETTTTTAYDKLTVTAGTATVATYSNLNHSSAYVQHSFILTGDAGKSVAVAFKGVEDSSLQTSFYLDDTALTLS
jgi:subtilase family serine protease